MPALGFISQGPQCHYRPCHCKERYLHRSILISDTNGIIRFAWWQVQPGDLDTNFVVLLLKRMENRFSQSLLLDHDIILKEVVPPLPSSISSIQRLPWLLRSSPPMQFVSAPKWSSPLFLKKRVHFSSTWLEECPVYWNRMRCFRWSFGSTCVWNYNRHFWKNRCCSCFGWYSLFRSLSSLDSRSDLPGIVHNHTALECVL